MAAPVAAGAGSGMGAALIEAGGAALGGGFQGMGAAQSAKATKYQARKAAREQKRKTLADLLNEALKREFEAGQNLLKRQQEYRGEESRALQNLANQYVQALR